jgi:chromosomal replication initiation ATPase DnaA
MIENAPRLLSEKEGCRMGTVLHSPPNPWQEEGEVIDFNLGPPGTGKTHLAIGLDLKAVQQGPRTLFTSAMSFVAALTKAYVENPLEERLKQNRVPKLLIIDEIGYYPH